MGWWVMALVHNVKAKAAWWSIVAVASLVHFVIKRDVPDVAEASWSLCVDSS